MLEDLTTSHMSEDLQPNEGFEPVPTNPEDLIRTPMTGDLGPLDAVSEMAYDRARGLVTGMMKDDRNRELEGQLLDSANENVRMAELARIDPLTGLANELRLTEAFEALKRAASPNSQRAGDNLEAYLVFIDLDNFGQVNKDHGHIIGDEALLAVAAAMRKNIRERDIPARLHGDELAMLLVGITELRMHEVVESLRIRIEKTNGPATKITGSIGVVPANFQLPFAENLVAADAASRVAKNMGKNRVVYDNGLVASK